MPSLTLEIKPQSSSSGKDLHSLILGEVRRRVKMAEREMGTKRKDWDKMEDDILAFIPETVLDDQRRHKRDIEGKPQYTTLKIPYAYGVMLSAWTYWTTVFFSRDPWFQFAGRHGEAEDQVLALEALISYQILVGENQAPMYSWLYDAGRYGVGVMSLFWDEEIKRITQITEEPELDPLTQQPILGADGQPIMVKYQDTTEIRGYTGNRLWNVNPKDFLWDPRQTVRNFQRGEFCAVRHKLPYVLVKQRERLGYYTNVDNINPNIVPRFEEEWNNDTSSLERPEDFLYNSEYGNSLQEKKHPTTVPVYECYIKLIPKDWKLGKGDYPEIWVFTVTGDWKTVIGAQPLGALHNKYPFAVIEIEADAYAFCNRGIPETIGTVQNTLDWLLNSHFFNVRASLNNLFVVDPTRVVMKDLTSPLPGGIIRLKPGWNLKEGMPVQQLPIQDITQNNMADMQTMLGIGERTTGVNDQIMGVLNQAVGRKTATEVRQSSTFGANRQKTICEYMSAAGFTPLAQLLVSNSQQYYDAEKKFKIVGSLAQLAGQQFIMVDPDTISGDYDFIPVDGTLPIDRFAQANLWKDLMGNLRLFPQLMQGIDMFKLFSWVANLAGLRNFQNFRLQIMPPGQQVPAEPGMVPLTQGGLNGAAPMLNQNGPGNGAQGGMGPISLPTPGAGIQ